MKEIFLVPSNSEDSSVSKDITSSYPFTGGLITSMITLIVVLTAYSKIQLSLFNKLVETVLKYNRNKAD